MSHEQNRSPQAKAVPQRWHEFVAINHSISVYEHHEEWALNVSLQAILGLTDSELIYCEYCLTRVSLQKQISEFQNQQSHSSPVRWYRQKQAITRQEACEINEQQITDLLEDKRITQQVATVLDNLIVDVEKRKLAVQKSQISLVQRLKMQNLSDLEIRQATEEHIHNQFHALFISYKPQLIRARGSSNQNTQ